MSGGMLPEGQRYDRFGNRVTSRAKPKVYKVRRGHAAHELERRDGEVRAVCECGSTGIWYRDAGPYGVEQAEADHDRHSRGLGGRA